MAAEAYSIREWGYGGVKPRERRKLALGALEKIGLSDRIKNKPNKISGSRNKEERLHEPEIASYTKRKVGLLLPMKNFTKLNWSKEIHIEFTSEIYNESCPEGN